MDEALRNFLEIPFLTTDRGRELWLEELIQRRTYINFLQVLPHPKVNARVMGEIRTEAQKLGTENQPIFLIDPVPINYANLFHEELRQERHSQGETMERLPSVVCMADLHSGEIRGQEGCCSSLTVVWFQDNLAMPIDPIVEAKLKAIDWDAHAHAWEW